ncbi:FtsX-like permease family protein [Streptomyces sp. CB03238]|uniref:FtsX-like permease family protein n=1 Tax=Streptomyces sp. CB03238 TaxID=1907777 RepID=UPI0015C470BE|nr:FtsX-like permease family protein [Streptomyces sp. CB03238]
MWRLSLSSVRHRALLFAGTFVSLMLGVTLIGLSVIALTATWNVERPPDQSPPPITVEDGQGTTHVFAPGGLDMGGVQTVLILTGVVAAFLTCFVVAGTCALSTALRRQELGMLRLAGMSGRQLRRMVTWECVAVAAPAALMGCLLASVAAPWAVSALNATGLSPAELRTGPVVGPLIVAASSGFVLAVLGSRASSRRAARVRPAEALREARLDTRVMTAGRSVTGAVALAAGCTALALTPGAGLEAAMPLTLCGTLALTLAASSLAPLLLPAVVRLAAVPLRGTRSVPVRLAVEATRTARLRTGALTVPVLVVLTVIAVFSSVLAATSATAGADDRQRTLGQLLVEPVSGGGLDDGVLAALRGDPRVAEVSAPASVELAVADETTARQDKGAAVDLPALARTHRIDVREGATTALAADTVAISKEFSDWYGYHVGTRLTYGLPHSKPVTARVSAVLEGGSAVPHVLVPAGAPGAPLPQRATVLLADPGKDAPGDVARELTALLGPGHVRVTTTPQWFAESSSGQDRATLVLLMVLAVPAATYALIAVGCGRLMAYSRRGSEIASMRLLGASRRQVRMTALWEAVATTVVAVAVAAVLAAVSLLAYRSALDAAYGTTVLGVPWGVLLGLTGACLAVASAAGLLSVQRFLGREQGTACAS